MKKKILIALSYVLIAALAITGTIAYLSDTDEDVNVMTLGNVKIDQIELQRAEGVAYNATASKAANTLVPYEQGQPLYPAVPNPEAAAPYQAAGTGDMFYWGDYVFTGTSANGLWNDANLANVMDKMVFVENTGKSDLYFRTLIAFEYPEGTTLGDAQNGHDIGFNCNGYNDANSVYKWSAVGVITVDEVRYGVYEAIYNATANGLGILKPGQTSHPSLLQVVMHHSLGNDDVAKYGNTYDILVLSQAIQTNGFDNAEVALDTGFGKPEEKAAEWFGGEEFTVPAVVSDQEGLEAALDEGVQTIYLQDGEYALETGMTIESSLIAVGENVAMDIPAVDVNKQQIVTVSGNDVTISGIDFVGPEDGDADIAYPLVITGDNVTIENCTIDTTGTNYYNVVVGSTAANAVIRGCVFDGGMRAIGNSYGEAGSTVLIEDCEFVNAAYAIHFDGVNAEVTIKDCEIEGISAIGRGGNGSFSFEKCAFSDDDWGDALNLYRNISFTDCSFESDNALAIGNSGITLTFNNCTWEGYTSVANRIENDTYGSATFVLVENGVTYQVAGNGTLTKVD